jgi:hypothetical protein
LAERDARINELTAHSGGQTGFSGEPHPDTDALVSRLEQLLDELERKDEREASLQEMLRLAEEANRAEREEREQIESWLNEIEQRIAERETEWHAARDELGQRIETLTYERDQAASTAAHGSHSPSHNDNYHYNYSSSSSSSTSNSNNTPHEYQLNWRQPLATSAEHSHEARESAAASETTDGITTAAELRASAEAELREERLRIAQERAILARQRADLEHEKRGVERGPSDLDQRVQALREHLREVHQRQAAKEKEESKTLAGRLARLWKRLDG